jgi:hypothetical protein
MSSPHVAGAAALLLEAQPGIPEYKKKKFKWNAVDVRARLQNSAQPTLWSGNPGLGFLEQVHRQGAGMLDIEAALLAPADVTPGKLSLGEGQAGPQTRTLAVRTNFGQGPVTYDLSYVTALATGPKSQTNFAAVSTFLADATVAFSVPSVTVPGNRGIAEFDVTITPPAAPDLGQYGGYIVLTPQGGGQVLRVPFAGFIGDYQMVPVLTPTANGFPWLAQVVGTSFFNRPTGATYTMVGDDIPYFLVHLDHHSGQLEMTVTRTDGERYFNFVFEQFVGRNTSATGFFAFGFDGNTFRPKGPMDGAWPTYVVPDGDYTVTIRVIKALGSWKNASDVETWTSPVFTIDRP